MPEITNAISRVQTQFTAALVTALGSLIQASLILAFGYRAITGQVALITTPSFLTIFFTSYVFPVLFFLNVTLFFSTPIKVLVSPRNYAIALITILTTTQMLLPAMQFGSVDLGIFPNLLFVFPALLLLRILYPRILGLALVDSPLYAANYVHLRMESVEEMLDKTAVRRAFGITEKDKSAEPFVIYRPPTQRSYQLQVFLREREASKTEIRFVAYAQNDYETTVTDATKLRFKADVEAIREVLRHDRGTLPLYDLTEEATYDKELAIRIAEKPTQSPLFTALRIPTVGAVIGLAIIALLTIGFLHYGEPNTLDTNNSIAAALTVAFFSALYVFEAYRSKGAV